MGVRIIEGWDVVLTYPDDILKFHCESQEDLGERFRFRHCNIDGELVEHFIVYTNRLVGVLMNPICKGDK